MKTLMVSFQPKWARMILSGEKKYEFRQGNFVNAKTGDKFLILESLGKKSKCNPWTECIGGKCENYTEETKVINNEGHMYVGCKTFNGMTDLSHRHEGTGKVIGEFIVGEVHREVCCGNYYGIPYLIALKDEYKDKNSTLKPYEFMERNYKIIELDKAREIGYTDQPLAFEITQLTIYDTPRYKSEYVVASKWEAFCKCMTEENQTEKYYSYVYGKNGYVVRSPQSFMYVIDTKTVI